MKLRRLFAAVAATAVAATLAISASANEAFLMYTDDVWGWGNWGTDGFPAGNTDVNGSGTYTVYVDNTMASATVEDEETGDEVIATANGAMVFCVDIEGLATDYNCGKDAEGYENCKTTAEKMAFAKSAGVNVTNVSITTTSSDGTTADIAVDQSKVLFGDIEGNGKIRIEIQNEYGDTAGNPCIDKSTISFDEKIAVTFTIELSAADAAPAVVDTAAPAAGDVAAATDSSKGSPDTGIADVAAVAGLALVAAGALVVSKKRK